MPLSVTNVFTANTAIVASQVNANFDDVEAALASLDTTNLSDNAGIRATQLADRYAIWSDGFWLVPPISAAGAIRPENSGTGPGPTVFTGGVETNGQFYTILSKYFVADTAQECYLYEIEIRVGDRSANTQIQVLINGVVVGGNAVTLDTDASYYRARNASPTDAPMAAINDGDEITIQLAAVAAGTDTLRGVHITFRYKGRLTN